MQSLQCENCGAPLKIKPRDFKRGYATCQFCGNTYSFGSAAAPELDPEVKRGLKLLSMMDRMFELAPPDLNEPAEQPADTKIELRNIPGYSFHTSIPRRGLSLPLAGLGLFTVFWCGFMIVWNTIAITQGEWLMLLFGILHDAVGIGLLLLVSWKVFGQEELIADHFELTRIKRLFGISREKVIPLESIQDVVFKVTSRDSNSGRVKRGLFLSLGGKRQRIASNTNRAEQRWIRTELLKFLKLDT